MAYNSLSDNLGNFAQLPPSRVRIDPEAAFSVTSASSVQKTADQSEFIEIHSSGVDVLFKWGTTACTTSNFDGIVKAETNRHYVSPNGTTAINFITASGTASVILIRQ
jgi:hypothetical protein